jgi:hypothetical protein
LRGGRSAKESEIDWLEVLKWVLIVLAAGFVGQFGKRLADHLIARSRRRRIVREQTQALESPKARAGLSDTTAATAGRSADKAAKKSAKAQVKRDKKAPG